MMSTIDTTVLKLGGELLEDGAAMAVAARAIVRLARQAPLVVVHGGGRAIDAELRARGVAPRFVDGLRVTDAPALDVVVSVLAGRNNTMLVAAIAAEGGRAIGLTGADGMLGLCAVVPSFETVSGAKVDLGLVGRPVGTDARLLADLIHLDCVPVVASVGLDAVGRLLNVNADVLAAHLAAVLPARRLIVAGATAGVLDAEGRTIAELPAAHIDAMATAGTAHSGMLAKLAACRDALQRGVGEVAIVCGRDVDDYDRAPGTRISLSRTLTVREPELMS